MPIEIADRLKKLPPYVFVEVDRLKKEALKRGADIVNFGVGDPDLPTPAVVVEALAKTAHDAPNHRYPDGEGMRACRAAACDYYARRFSVKLDPDAEATTLIGSKEGIGHVALALVNPGQVVAYPDPGYPVYHAGTLFAGGKSHRFYLNEANNFLPDLEKLPASVLSRIKLLWVNYPHSPTGAVAPMSYLKKLVALAKKHGFYICSDAAYADIYYDGAKPHSLLEVPGAKKVAIEFYSCSKPFNMTGWRLGFALGNPEMVAALRKIKNNLDSGQFNAVQYAGIAAFENAERIIAENNAVYQRRRDLLLGGLNRLGWGIAPPPATFYVWAKTRGGLGSMAMTKKLIQDYAIVTTPGVGLGAKSDGHIRMTLTTTEERIQAALQRLEAAPF